MSRNVRNPPALAVGRFKYLLPLGLFVILLIFLAVGLTLNPREVPSPLVGKPAPQFRLSQLADAGKTLSTDDLKGRVSLLNVWASWCVACREEHPLLLDLARLEVVPIYGLNYKDQRGDARAWLKRLGNPYTTSAYDPEGKIGIEWGVYGVPETFIIDQQGIIRHKHIGPITPEVLEKEILPLIKSLKLQTENI